MTGDASGLFQCENTTSRDAPLAPVLDDLRARLDLQRQGRQPTGNFYRTFNSSHGSTLHTLFRQMSTGCVTFHAAPQVNYLCMKTKKIPFAPLLEKWVAKGGSQASLARELDVTAGTITNWIARKAIPTASLHAVAHLLGIGVDDYLAEIGHKPQVGKAAPFSADIQKIIEEWPLLMPKERKAILDDIVAKAEYNRAVHNQLGKLPTHAEDARVGAAYNRHPKAKKLNG